jgi:hypothetical protein
MRNRKPPYLKPVRRFLWLAAVIISQDAIELELASATNSGSFGYCSAFISPYVTLPATEPLPKPAVARPLPDFWTKSGRTLGANKLLSHCLLPGEISYTEPIALTILNHASLQRTPEFEYKHIK